MFTFTYANLLLVDNQISLPHVVYKACSISSCCGASHTNNFEIICCHHYFRKISEGTCDTEDWRNDTENSALVTAINYILQCIHIEKITISVGGKALQVMQVI